jgi:hypothetical protein
MESFLCHEKEPNSISLIKIYTSRSGNGEQYLAICAHRDQEAFSEICSVQKDAH